jgi:hypothetical protein
MRRRLICFCFFIILLSGGWVTMGLLSLVIGGGMTVSLKQIAPPGPIKSLFKVIFTLEDRLNETPEQRKERLQKAKDKVTMVTTMVTTTLLCSAAVVLFCHPPLSLSLQC